MALTGAGVGESRARYSTDPSDAEWEILRPLVPAGKPGGRPPRHTRREIVNALARSSLLLQQESPFPSSDQKLYKKPDAYESVTSTKSRMS